MTYGEAAAGAVTGLSRQPALLLIAVLNVLMLLGVGFVAKSQVDERRALGQQQSDIVKMLLERCRDGAPKP